MVSQKIRIILTALDYKTIEKSVHEIVTAAKRTGARLSGPVPLPKSIRKYTILKSPHVNKDARNQLQISQYKMLVDILDYSDKTMDSLMRLDLPAGVNVKVSTKEENKEEN